MIGAWRGASSTPLDGTSGTTAIGASPVSASAPSLVPNGNGELQVYFYGAQSHTGPTIALSSSLNQHFDIISSKEGFALAYGDLVAPPAGTQSPTYPAKATLSGTTEAMTAQAVLLAPASDQDSNKTH